MTKHTIAEYLLHILECVSLNMNLLFNQLYVMAVLE